jgi:hypothetical protein
MHAQFSPRLQWVIASVWSPLTLYVVMGATRQKNVVMVTITTNAIGGAYPGGRVQPRSHSGLRSLWARCARAAQ